MPLTPSNLVLRRTIRGNTKWYEIVHEEVRPRHVGIAEDILTLVDQIEDATDDERNPQRIPGDWWSARRKNRQIRAARSGVVSGDLTLRGMSVPETDRLRENSIDPLNGLVVQPGGSYLSVTYDAGSKFGVNFVGTSSRASGGRRVVDAR